ncbi:MAG: ROK family protein [Gordonibacter sp.]|uniref:ROK family protein n=1 Tax=Gordonibacter sp. TaxID=1968902 RepID=UPI002FCA56E0
MSVDYPCTIAAFDVGGTKMAGALVRYPAVGVPPKIEAIRSVPTEAGRGGEAVLEALLALVANVTAEAEGPLVGIGVGAAGCVDVRTGGIAFANELMPGWTGQPVAERLRTSFGLSVAVLNDVKAHALGEARWGAAQGAQTCLVIAVGTGLGGGIVADGRVLLGARGFAGELGCTPCPDKLGTPRACGTASELESIAAGTGIENRYRTAGGERLCGREIAQRAADGEELAQHIIREAGTALGEAIAAWTDLLDPEFVVLSGSVCNAGPLWRAALHEGFERQAPPLMRGMPIVDAALGGQAPLIGAAEYLLDSLKGRS